jgi:hypothetical protein
VLPTAARVDPANNVADMAMIRRTLGGTGADVTTLSYGAMELRGQPRRLIREQPSRGEPGA